MEKWFKIDYEAIMENIRKYIERKGKPLLYRGKKEIKECDTFTHRIIEIYETFPSIEFILNNCKIAIETYQNAYKLVTTGYVDDYEKIHAYLLEKGGFWNKFMAVTSSWMAPRKYPLEEIICEMAVREKEEDKKETYFINGFPHPVNFRAIEWNVVHQPSLNNALAFRNYLRLKERTNKEIYSDKKLMDLLEKIPLDLRNPDIEGYANKEINLWKSELKHAFYPTPTEIISFSAG